MTDIKVWESYSKHDIGAGAHGVLPAFSFYVPTFRPLGIVYVVNFHYICRYNQIYGIDHVQQVCNKINRL